MIGAVTGRSVAMAPAIVSGEQRVERSQQVDIGAGSRFKDRHSTGRVRHEHVDEAISPPCTEGRDPPGDVEDRRTITRDNVDEDRVHAGSDVVAEEDLRHRGIHEDRLEGLRDDRGDRQHDQLVELGGVL